MIISVVIPVRDGAKTIKKCLNGLFNQTLHASLEVIVIDSGSTDGTLELLREYPVRLLQIPPKEFNHGATRNFGVQEAHGKLIYFTVQDAWTDDPKLLELMAAHFEDPEVVGVCGQQIVPHDSTNNPLEWFRPISNGEVRAYQYPDPKEFKRLSGREKRWICGWDDVNAMYRTEIVRNQLSFRPIAFGEDMDWAHRAITKGFKLVYDTKRRVNHYHHHSSSQMFRRKLNELEVDYQQFELLPSINYSMIPYLRVFYRCIKHKVKPYWLWYNWKKLYQEFRAAKHFLKKIAHETNH
tara:strand:+ start:1365 stop:2249 length:885 start_codon:yes stop_codon:yes gene_type:complete